MTRKAWITFGPNGVEVASYKHLKWFVIAKSHKILCKYALTGELAATKVKVLK